MIPYQNHFAELKLELLPNKGRGLMSGANVSIDLFGKVSFEAIGTATLTDGLRAIMIYGNTAMWYKHLFEVEPIFVRFLCAWMRLEQ